MNFRSTHAAAVTAAMLFAVLCVDSLAAQIIARGRLLDKKGKGAPEIRVVVREARTASETDENGWFEIRVPSPGFYTIRADYDGKVFIQRREIRFNKQELIFYLSPRSKPPARASNRVGDGSLRVVGLKDRTRLSRFRLKREEIKRLPGVYGDSLKAVNTLPGITPSPPIGSGSSVFFQAEGAGFGLSGPYSNSISGNLVMRGAGSLSSRFYLDGFIMQYPYHLGDQSSVVHNDYIRTLDVYTGAFPARFGNATGGIIAVGGPEKVKKPEGNINISLFKADVFYQTPLFDGNAFIVGTARGSYPNYTLLKLYPDAVPPDAKYAQYKDGQYKFVYRPTRNHEFTAIYFGATDLLKYSQAVDEATNDTYGSGGFGGLGGNGDSNTDGRPPIGLNRDFHTQGIKYSYGTGRLRNDIYLQVSRFRELSEIDFRSPFTGESIFRFQIKNARREIQYRDEFQAELIRDTLVISAGLEANLNRWELSLANLSPRETSNSATATFTDTINNLIESNRTFRALFDGDRTEYQLNAAYVQADIDIWKFRITPGARVEHYTLSKSTGVGPRLGLEFNPTETVSFLAGAGRHYNLPPTLDTVSIESGNPDLEMEEADHVVLGYEQKIGAWWKLKIELYRNIFRNIVVPDRFAVRPFELRVNRRDLVEKLDDILANPFENRPLGYSNDGTGHSRGVEIYLKKTRPPGRSGWFGWISYTWSITKRNNHQTRFTDDEESAYNARNANRTVLATADIGRDVLLYYNTGELEYYRDNDREELYDLDRTHQISLVLNYKFNPRWQLGSRWRYASNTPYTPSVQSNQLDFGANIRPLFLQQYSDFFNSDRRKPVHQLDLRLDYFTRYSVDYAK